MKKENSKVFQQILGMKTFKHKEGKFFLWDIPCFIDPIYMQVYQNSIMQEAIGEEKANKIKYYTAKLQAKIGLRIVNERFGYMKTNKEKKESLLFNEKQTELLGFGKFEFVKIDFENDIFIVKGIPTFAKEYKRFLGMENKQVDYWSAGMYAGVFEIYTDKKMVCIETQCIVEGKDFCTFVIKPVKNWDLNEPIVKKNLFLFKNEKIWKELANKYINKLGPFEKE